ncbi:MAG: hypothetical protein ACK4N5_26870 [Myxococcales bacterium]
MNPNKKHFWDPLLSRIRRMGHGEGRGLGAMSSHTRQSVGVDSASNERHGIESNESMDRDVSRRS